MYKEFNASAIEKRVNSMLNYREQFETAGVDGLHVKFSFGNRKTGAAVPSVSLIPVADCANCKVCAAGCYDVRNVCYLPAVQKSRANNSAILRKDPERYFAEIAAAVRFFRFFRWHVGGDLVSRSYWLRVVEIANNTPGCEFLIFTKLYGVINKFLSDGGQIPTNLHVIFSDWRGAKFTNPFNLPVSSPVWFDNNGVEIERGPHCTDKFTWCPGFCEDCAAAGSGCFGLKAGETVLFAAH